MSTCEVISLSVVISCKFIPISLKYCKCCHFFAFYLSVSCKNQDNREWIRKSHGRSRKISFIDFLILFWFADFLIENPSNVTEINVKCEKSAKSWISNFTYFIWVWSLRKNALHATWWTIFQPCVPFRWCVCCPWTGWQSVQLQLCRVHHLVSVLGTGQMLTQHQERGEILAYYSHEVSIVAPL